MYINLMNLTKSFIVGLGQYMCKANRPLDGMDSLNPHRWRGKWLHHHGGDVCCVFVLCVAVSSGCHCWYVKNYQKITLRYAYYLTIRLIGVTQLPTHACTMPAKHGLKELFLRCLR
jgi:hypothetical protein